MGNGGALLIVYSVFMSISITINVSMVYILRPSGTIILETWRGSLRSVLHLAPRALQVYLLL